MPSKLRFFPFGDEFDPGMGARALRPHEPLFDIDPERYLIEVALKTQQLGAAHADYFRGGADLMQAQWDVLELVLTDLSTHHPEHFRLDRHGDEWHWHNTLLGIDTRFHFGDAASLPYEPLDWAGRQVQEDLVLLASDSDATFVGGQLCFANGWDIGERVGHAYLRIHKHTPGVTMPSVHAGSRFLAALKPERTMWRMSWNFKLTDQMDLTTRHIPEHKADFERRAPTLTPEQAGAEIFVRIERQTFTRLPRSGGVLFGIHTYNSLLEVEAADPDRARRILRVVQGSPREVRDYKAITPMEGPMLSYLESRARLGGWQLVAGG